MRRISIFTMRRILIVGVQKLERSPPRPTTSISGVLGARARGFLKHPIGLVAPAVARILASSPQRVLFLTSD
jgi:hypothetical protein